ncbi:hypothetical protein [Streptomyces sp. KAU_LT]|uniref:hypothetical protein n=1 Tax=Streptomyces sp. KAU_LT TaxID=3046669 RepID=UPI0024B63E9F|nr:hypothetical protein [Streptomyces sp. KAU_LT]MDI9834735.1 hypothetical protein [Streptomyces sp. KAU_LT]
MSASLDGCWAKLRRAEYHLDTLCAEMADFQTSRPHRVSVERDETDQAWIFRLWNVSIPDPGWGLILGDCLHNARSALDHLVYELALLNLARPLTDNEARRVQFPIAADAQKFQKQAPRLQDLRTVDKARLEELQPYHAWDETLRGSHEMPGPPAPIPLYLDELTKLNNVDKHRTITPVWMGAGLGALPKGAQKLGITGSSTTGNVLTEGCEIGRWIFAVAPPEIPAGLQAELYFSVQPSLREPYFGTSVERIARNCLLAVRMTLEMFAPCFTGGQNPAPLRYWDGSPPWL